MATVCTPLTADNAVYTADNAVLTADLTEVCVTADQQGAGSGGRKTTGWPDIYILYQLRLWRQKLEELREEKPKTTKKAVPVPTEVRREIEEFAEEEAPDISALLMAVVEGNKTLDRRLALLEQVEKRIREIQEEEDEVITMFMLH